MLTPDFKFPNESPEEDLSGLFMKLFTIILLAFASGGLISVMAPEWRWEQIPFHSFIEGIGGFTAILVALMLPRFLEYSDEIPPFIWVGAALISMGTLDIFHAVVYPGQEFIWFHSVANFAGGILFACVWLPESLIPQSKRKQFMIVALLASCMVGFVSFVLPEVIPAMRLNGQFSTPANILNLLGGIGFMLAAAYFIAGFIKKKSVYCSVLANHCFLFGISGLLFNLSALWDGVWWEWHILRFAAYAFILYFFYLTYQHERNRHHERLSRLSQAIQYNGEAVMLTDRKGVIEYINPAFTTLTGYSPEEALGQTPKLLKSDAQDPTLYTQLWDTINAGDVWSGTLIEKRRDGSFYPAIVTVSPIKDSDNITTHFVSTQKDMTEYHKLEDQFRQAQKLESIGTLVGGIAHDFNNMLAAIDGNIYLAKMNLDNKLKAEEKLDNVEQLSSRAADIVRQLLAYARKDMVSMEPIELNEFMANSNKLAKSLFPENVDYNYHSEHQNLIVNADTTQLQQMMLNLLANAAHAVRDVEKPTITTSLKHYIATDAFLAEHPNLKSHQFAQITIRDNGYGISKENLGKIVDPFFTTKGVGEGIGLGLSMVSGSIQRHGGALKIESCEGEGTSCHIFMPLSDKEERPQPLLDSNTSLQGKGETILLVDDEKDLVNSISSVLRSLKYQVLTASDGEVALKMYESNRDSIALVITDLVMPTMGGSELMTQIWKKDGDIPAIFVSGYNMEKSTIPDNKAAQSMMINKPFSINMISQHIRELLD